jgi:hypothetical protein
MLLETRKSLSILTVRTRSDTVREYRFKSIEVAPHNIRMLVSDQASQMLPHASPHDTSLPVIHDEAFLDKDGGHMR